MALVCGGSSSDEEATRERCSCACWCSFVGLLRFDLVAHATHRLDARTREALVELVPQGMNVHVHHIRRAAHPFLALGVAYVMPCWRICWTTVWMRLDGIAKLTPSAWVLVSVFTAPANVMPMSCPCKLIRAPPLLPGLRAASV